MPTAIVLEHGHEEGRAEDEGHALDLVHEGLHLLETTLLRRHHEVHDRRVDDRVLQHRVDGHPGALGGLSDVADDAQSVRACDAHVEARREVVVHLDRLRGQREGRGGLVQREADEVVEDAVGGGPPPCPGTREGGGGHIGRAKDHHIACKGTKKKKSSFMRAI